MLISEVLDLRKKLYINYLQDIHGKNNVVFLQKHNKPELINKNKGLIKNKKKKTFQQN
jgi:hypothetical protein